MPIDNEKGKEPAIPRHDYYRSGGAASQKDEEAQESTTTAMRDKYPQLYPPEDAPAKDRAHAERIRSGTTADASFAFESMVWADREAASRSTWLSERKLNFEGIKHEDFGYPKSDSKRYKNPNPNRDQSFDDVKSVANEKATKSEDSRQVRFE